MDKNKIKKTLELLRANSPKKKFSQTIELIVNLKDLDIKKPENNVDVFPTLPHGRGKKVKTCAFVDDEQVLAAKELCDFVVEKDQFSKISKQDLKKFASKADFTIAQAALMPQIAGAFGKVLGPKGKMPSPKAGGIIPPKAELEPILARLTRKVKLKTHKETIVKCPVGTEAMTDDELIDNIMAVLMALTHALPSEENNIKNMFLKMTMGAPIKVGEEGVKKK